MVRIKNRYLLVQALYPHQLSTKSPIAPNAQPSMLAAPAPASDTLLRLYAPTPDRVEGYMILRNIRNAIQTLFGEHGAGMAAGGLKVNYWSNATSCAIVRCRREAVRMVWAACCFMNGLKPESGAEVVCVLRVVRVSGTIRKCEQEAIRRARALMTRAKALQDAETNGINVKDAIGLGPGALDGEDMHGPALGAVDDGESDDVD